MVSREHSEKRRLYPVVATILRFTSAEVSLIASALESAREDDFVPESTISDLSSFAASSLSSIFFGGTTLSSSSSASSTSAAHGRSHGADGASASTNTARGG